ncbi:PfkB family carbohydrate kinase [Streptomyces sp. NPDC058086]|uniref:PfkB family carbohydrate kinase n=1 Tax=Streptomyces sp. NPDC058086 TaxID=3346334 RepID=UPI0036E70694
MDVVDPVGAGDAFAAGFLSATLRGLPVGARLRHGQLMAAAALTFPATWATRRPPACQATTSRRSTTRRPSPSPDDEGANEAVCPRIGAEG